MSEEHDQKSIQIRALLAFALSALVLFLYSHFFVKQPPPPPRPPDIQTAQAPPQPPPKTAEPAPRPSRSKAAPAESAGAEQNVIVETDNYLVSFSNRGAVVASWTLKHFKDEAGRPLELVNTAAAPTAGRPFSLEFRDSTPPSDPNQALFVIEGASSGRVTGSSSVTFRWSDGNLKARKTFRFTQNSYVVDVDSEVTQDGNPLPHLLTWLGGFGDLAVEDAASKVRTFYFEPNKGKVEHLEAKAAEKGPVVHSGPYPYAGVEDHYFVAAFMPSQSGVSLQLETRTVEAPTPQKQEKQRFAGAAVGIVGDNRFNVYIGPKEQDILKSVNESLAKLVDFGFFGFIAYPLYLGVKWIYKYAPNFGWAIVIVTIIINFMLFPLKLKSMKSMKKMQKLQPLIKHINDKYKNISLRDPKRQDQNKEVMELYSRYGVNPIGGCLPLLLQMPFFFAFYTVLDVSIEMRNAVWLWVKDLSARDYYYILPLAMIATQFWYQKMTPATTADPAQQKMMQFMPLIMGFFFYRLPSGLVLYWLTGNLVGILQQWLINRLPEPELEVEIARKGKPKKPKV